MARQKVSVTIYEKPSCSACRVMRDAFNNWLCDTNDRVSIAERSAIEEVDFLIADGHLSAPVYYIERDGESHSVSGMQPDLLVDLLQGDDSIWE